MYVVDYGVTIIMMPVTTTLVALEVKPEGTVPAVNMPPSGQWSVLLFPSATIGLAGRWSDTVGHMEKRSKSTQYNI